MLNVTFRHTKTVEIMYLYLLKKLGGLNSASHVAFPIKTSLAIVRPKMTRTMCNKFVKLC